MRGCLGKGELDLHTLIWTRGSAKGEEGDEEAAAADCSTANLISSTTHSPGLKGLFASAAKPQNSGRFAPIAWSLVRLFRC